VLIQAVVVLPTELARRLAHIRWDVSATGEGRRGRGLAMSDEAAYVTGTEFNVDGGLQAVLLRWPQGLKAAELARGPLSLVLTDGIDRPWEVDLGCLRGWRC
jgi:hypothetical protein